MFSRIMDHASLIWDISLRNWKVWNSGAEGDLI